MGISPDDVELDPGEPVLQHRPRLFEKPHQSLYIGFPPEMTDVEQRHIGVIPTQPGQLELAVVAEVHRRCKFLCDYTGLMQLFHIVRGGIDQVGAVAYPDLVGLDPLRFQPGCNPSRRTLPVAGVGFPEHVISIVLVQDDGPRKRFRYILHHLVVIDEYRIVSADGFAYAFLEDRAERAEYVEWDPSLNTFQEVCGGSRHIDWLRNYLVGERPDVETRQALPVIALEQAPDIDAVQPAQVLDQLRTLDAAATVGGPWEFGCQEKQVFSFSLLNCFRKCIRSNSCWRVFNASRVPTALSRPL